MENLLLHPLINRRFDMRLLLITYLMVTVNLSWAGGEMKKVCHDEKGKQVCKTIKVHKKLEGTKVPPK
jgi:hypothetical protein